MKNFFRVTSTILSIGILAGTIWVFFNVQSVLDWWVLRSYEPTPAIAQLSEEASFNEEGEKLFFVHDPELLKKGDFDGKCSLTEETIVLGCYITRDKIYVFDVEDERLEGVEQVTAAHEMLHAAYDRLSRDEKSEIDQILLSYYEATDNERLIKTVENYRERDPTVVPNELHSILGTEIRDLPVFLEQYYSRYFVDRTKVVDLAEAYEDEFTKLEDQIEVYDKQLKELSVIISEKENQVLLLGSALEDEQQALDSLRSSPSLYNESVPSFNQKVREYNALLNSLRTDITEYNEIVKERNKIAIEEQGLIDAIDTRAVEL